MSEYTGKQLAEHWMPLAARLWSTQDSQTKAIAVALASAYRQGQAEQERRIAALEAENAALREDKARLVEALESIRNWRPPDGTLLQVKDLQ